MRRLLLIALCAACSHDRAHETRPVERVGPRTITIIGTNDLHGALDRLPIFAGFVANVRAARASDGGVLLLDGGDLFQGTLESNLGEGADVVRAYNALHYDASAIGNHEFDYGPVGPAVTAQSPSDDPRGALKRNIADAKFQFLVSNIVDDATGKRPPPWPNLHASTTIEVAGVKVGIVGASTESTPTTTMAANFKGLHMTPTVEAITSEAKALRAAGADVIVVVAHIGSECRDTVHHDDASSCDKRAELFALLDALPRGLVDVIVAGHTHNQIANRINGVAVIESFSSGRAFGRVDLVVVDHKVVRSQIYEPHLMCPLDDNRDPVPVAQCKPGDYEGRPVVADAAIQKIVDDAIARAGQKRDEKLGVTLTATVRKAYGTESELGDLMADLMLAARGDAQVALTNGGGLRASLPAGELTYGQLFQALPFDNRFALVDVDGAQLKKLVATNLQRGGGIFSWSGLTAVARCEHGKLDVDVAVAGKPLDEHARYKLVTSDFLATGGDGALAKLHLPATAITFTDQIIREAMASVLRARKGTIDPKQIVTPKRLDYPGKRPVRCRDGAAAGAGEDGE